MHRYDSLYASKEPSTPRPVADPRESPPAKWSLARRLTQKLADAQTDFENERDKAVERKTALEARQKRAEADRTPTESKGGFPLRTLFGSVIRCHCATGRQKRNLSQHLEQA